MGVGGSHPAWAPELLVKLNLLHCLIRAERATLEPALITLLFPTSFPEHLKSPFFPLCFCLHPHALHLMGTWHWLHMEGSVVLPQEGPELKSGVSLG